MRSHPLDIFLPAAGFGERLRPATNHLPKPLLPILGTPIIEGILGKLAAVCEGTIGINLHWKADLLRAWAAASLRGNSAKGKGSSESMAKRRSRPSCGSSGSSARVGISRRWFL